MLPIRSIHEMADRAAEAVRMKLADGIPYVCVGHGMGGILAYEVACRLKVGARHSLGLPSMPSSLMAALA